MEDITIKCGRLKFAVFFAFIWLCCGAVFSEDEKQPGKKEALPLEQRMQKHISVEFRDTPIEDAIMLMADQADVDIIKSPAVTGTVTVKLTDVPLEEALKNILAAHGYDFVSSENMIRVAPIAEITQVVEKIVTKTYRITYADVVEVAKALEKFRSKQGSLTFVQGTSNIIVTDTESKVKAIDDFIQEIDRVTPQVLVEVRIYDLTDTDKLDLGVKWSAGRRTNYTGTPMDSDITVSKGGSDRYISSRTNPIIKGTFESAISQAAGTTGLLTFGILTEHLDIDARLSAAIAEKRAKLLANPRILVLDNETATFKIVEERPFQQLTQTTEGGSIGTTEFKEVGVSLEVTPHIAPERGMVRLHLKPIFSVQTDTVNLTMPGFATIEMPQPVVDKREADTRVLVQDGQTVVLGGLRKQDMQKETSKVPVLADIPLLGRLFKFEGEKTITSEIVVFITPRIVMQPVLTELERQQFEATEIAPPEGPEKTELRVKGGAK